MERFRNALRNSFRSSKRKSRDTSSAAVVGDDNDPHRNDSDDKPSEDSEAVRNGSCNFIVKYYGSLPVFEPRGIELCRNGIKEAKRNFRKSKRKERDTKRFLSLQITGESLRLVNEQTKTLLADEPVEKVSFCLADRSHRRAFCFVSRDVASNAWVLHAFKTKGRLGGRPVMGERVCHAIGFAFQVFSERQKGRPRKGFAANGAASASSGLSTSDWNQAAAKLSPITEEDTVISSSSSIMARRSSSDENDADEPGDADCFENETSTLMLRGDKARMTIAVSQPAARTPPRRPPPFARNAAERRTIQTESPTSHPSEAGLQSDPRLTNTSSTFSVKLPGTASMRKAKTDLPPQPPQKSEVVSDFKKQLASRLLNESVDTSPAWRLSEPAPATQAQVTAEVPFETRFQHAALTTENFDSISRKLHESQSSAAAKGGRPEVAPKPQLDAKVVERLNSSGDSENGGKVHDDVSSPAVRNLVSKFERSSVDERSPRTDDPFGNAPLTNAQRARHSAR